MRYLSLRDPEAIADFIESVIEYLPEKERGEYETLEKAILAQEPVDPQELQARILALGKRTWIPRRAVDLYTKTILGARREWQKLEESLRPATLFLISRVRRNTSAMTLEEALRTGEADYALDDDERVEIQLLQLEIRIELWLEDQSELSSFLTDAKEECEALEKRLDAAKTMIEGMEDRKTRIEAEARHEDLTERIFFLGEVIPVDLLDHELRQA